MRRISACLVVLCLGLSACASSTRDDGVLRIYTSVTQATVDAVVAGFEAKSEIEIEVFRAPTGDLAGRIATEQRLGGIQADVLWLTDPLSIQQYAADGLLQPWRPVNADAVDPEFIQAEFFGTRLLAMVAVVQPGREVDSWSDLAAPELDGLVVLPDPGFAGSAFGAMGYFSQAPGFGLDYYRLLAANGAAQVSSPGDVITGVAEGRYAAGMTLDGPARTAVAKGSPVEIVYPAPGAVAIYSPIAVVEAGDVSEAESFVEHVLSVEGQAAIAATGWQPVRADVEWSESSGPLVYPDWAALFDRQDELLDQYREIFP